MKPCREVSCEAAWGCLSFPLGFLVDFNLHTWSLRALSHLNPRHGVLFFPLMLGNALFHPSCRLIIFQNPSIACFTYWPQFSGQEIEAQLSWGDRLTTIQEPGVSKSALSEAPSWLPLPREAAPE